MRIAAASLVVILSCTAPCVVKAQESEGEPIVAGMRFNTLASSVSGNSC